MNAFFADHKMLSFDERQIHLLVHSCEAQIEAATDNGDAPLAEEWERLRAILEFSKGETK